VIRQAWTGELAAVGFRIVLRIVLESIAADRARISLSNRVPRCWDGPNYREENRRGPVQGDDLQRELVANVEETTEHEKRDDEHDPDRDGAL
jgi:hypothetical protein